MPRLDALRRFQGIAARTAILLLIVVGSISAQPALAEAPATRPAAAQAATYTGEWATTFGRMRLVQTGDRVQGSYQTLSMQGTIRGRMKDSRLLFLYDEGRVTGEGWFELDASGTSFAGKWREKGTEDWATWQGRRVAAVVAEENFTGLWKTDFGMMRLRQTGSAVKGIYAFAGTSHVTGEVSGRVLKFHYEQPDGEKGEGQFELSPDAKLFVGQWKSTTSPGGAWNGARVLPEPGRTWLVVLEAPWERTLQDTEYSYGLMLKAFLARLPQVNVRHKIIGDEADLRRWCAELPYLAGPVVVYISSHGNKEGMVCGGKLVGAKVLAECLRDAGDVRLLHFGTCLVAGGDIPKQLHEMLGVDGNYPISGFANSADWSGSAIVDFTYLDLIFTRGMMPEEAVKQTRQMLSFARETSGPNDAIAGAGLVIFPASQPSAR